jgi:hypothetical protein
VVANNICDPPYLGTDLDDDDTEDSGDTKAEVEDQSRKPRMVPPVASRAADALRSPLLNAQDPSVVKKNELFPDQVHIPILGAVWISW